MAEPLQAPLPPDLDLPSGYVIRLRAVSPTDGSAITGVSLSKVSLLVSDVAGNLATTTVGPYMLVPGPNT